MKITTECVVPHSVELRELADTLLARLPESSNASTDALRGALSDWCSGERSD